MAASLATLLLETLKTNLALLELEPASGGCFEVFVDDEQIYSKLETGEFPDEKEIREAVLSRVA